MLTLKTETSAHQVAESSRNELSLRITELEGHIGSLKNELAETKEEYERAIEEQFTEMKDHISTREEMQIVFEELKTEKDSHAETHQHAEDNEMFLRESFESEIRALSQEIERASHTATKRKLDVLQRRESSVLDVKNGLDSDIETSFDSSDGESADYREATKIKLATLKPQSKSNLSIADNDFERERTDHFETKTQLSMVRDELAEIASKHDFESTTARTSLVDLETALEAEWTCHNETWAALDSLNSELIEMKVNLDLESIMARSDSTRLKEGLELEVKSHLETKTKLDSLESVLSKLKIKLDDSNAALSTSIDVEKALKSETEDHLTTQVKLAEESKGKFQAEIDGLKRDIESKSTEIASMRASLETFDGDKELLEGERRVLQSKVDQLMMNDDREEIAALLEKNLSLTEDLALTQGLLSRTRKIRRESEEGGDG
jgi:chromosome segregation ATPase